MKKINRDLKLITQDLHTALKLEKTNIIAIGHLLAEARNQVHGEWLSWLDKNFGMSVRTAENYLDAARFARKFATVANLKLHPTALYALGHDLKSPSGLYGAKTIRAILKAAKTEWINSERASAIAASLQKPKPAAVPPIIQGNAAEAVSPEEIDELLDGPPPELPRTPEAIVHDAIVPSFDQAITTLKRLQTKPVAKFSGTEHSVEDIKKVVDFLHCLLEAIDGRKKEAA